MLIKYSEYIKEALIYDCIKRNNIIEFDNKYYTLVELTENNINYYRRLVNDRNKVYCYEIGRAHV